MAVNPVEDFVRIYYHSAFGSHTMDRPVRTWSGVPWQLSGSFLNWNDGEINAHIMIRNLVDAFLPLFKPDTTFDSYEIFHVVNPGEKAIPVWAENFTGKVGSSVDTSQSRAWERTYTFRTYGSHIAKVCLLDTPCAGQVSRQNSIPAGYPDLEIIAEFCNPDNAWSGRANERPVFFKTLTTQTNQALEHKYGVN